MEVVTKTVDSQEEGLEQVCILLGETLVNGALSIKVTELCSKLLQEKGIYAKDMKEFDIYGLLKYFVNQIDKITAEIIEE